MILEKEFYHTQMTGMLSDGDTYTELKTDSTVRFKEKLKKVVESGYRARVLTKKKRHYLIPSSCRIPIIYTPPKIHKNSQCPLARLIENSIGSVNGRSGEYLDTFLQPSVIKTKAYLKDTKDLLQLLQGIDLNNT